MSAHLYASELPVADPEPGEHAQEPLFEVYLRDTPTGDLIEGTCPDCESSSVIERVEGTHTDYRCRCGQLLRVLG